MPQRLKITPEGMQALLERLYARSILADDYELIIAIMEAHVLVDSTLREAGDRHEAFADALRSQDGEEKNRAARERCETESSKGEAQGPWQKRPTLVHGKQESHRSPPFAQKRGSLSRMS